MFKHYIDVIPPLSFICAAIIMASSAFADPTQGAKMLAAAASLAGSGISLWFVVKLVKVFT